MPTHWEYPLTSTAERHLLEQIPLLTRKEPGTNTASNRRTNGQGKENKEEKHDLHIHLSFDGRPFDRSCTADVPFL